MNKLILALISSVAFTQDEVTFLESGALDQVIYETVYMTTTFDDDTIAYDCSINVMWGSVELV